MKTKITSLRGLGLALGVLLAFGSIAEAAISRDEALRSFKDFYQEVIQASGERYTLGQDELNDFDNLYNQAAEAGLYTGPGYGKPWAQLWTGYKEYIKSRFKPNVTTAASGQVGNGVVVDAELAADLRMMRSMAPKAPDAGRPGQITREQAFAIFRDFYLETIEKSGEKAFIFGREEINDFTNVYNQSAEAGHYTGSGYGKSWSSLFANHSERIQQRFRPTFSAGGRGGDADQNEDGIQD